VTMAPGSAFRQSLAFLFKRTLSFRIAA
jgi:hypothetical protein